ncbi:Molybdopterin molybdenumtransferase [Symmachiella dynata]|uniref:molybdopterin molybdotransferase MoeA n=1 Tax=Symmachiella dynata TaxID=2527995 RepID=UPI00118C16D4|nr:gephyrin-like molybdotransferase Glp [Symmachiella dynata]QDT51804.1 Molybdopterin molybdenumtransferase [Symmachiella dynata]
MFTVEQALDAIIAEVADPVASSVPLGESLGLVLAEDIDSDVDSPPFDKALMDGYAVRAADVESGRAELRFLEEVMAGQVPTRTVEPGCATRIMTGAPLPAGADAVVRVEDTQFRDSEEPALVAINGAPVSVGQSIMRQGTSTQRGQRVLNSGTPLRPQEIGTLAESGRDQVAVYPRPRVAILATGDELVPVNEIPQPGQIRNSNESMLAAQIQRAGGEPVPLGIARDERANLRERIEAGLACDLLLLSGGVSAGKLDLVPSELQAAGVRQVFHKVRVKPGKPLWFGVSERSKKDANPIHKGCYVFGLPGNPVSSMVCCEIFVRTALRRLLGIEPQRPAAVSARLEHEYRHQGNRPTYHPAQMESSLTGRTVSIVSWQGSSDLRATTAANGMVCFPAGEAVYSAGTVMDVYPW